MSNGSKSQLTLTASVPPGRRTVLLATVVNAIFVLTIQMLGLLTLVPASFGAFSLQYLLFALANSVCLSVICEPWLRTDLHQSHRSTWQDYSSVLLYSSLAAGLLTLIVSLLVPDLRILAASGSIAVLASTFRAGSRYYLARENNWSRIVVADTAGLVVTLITWFGSHWLGVPSLLALSMAWAAGSVAAALLSPRPSLQGPKSNTRWVSTHRRHLIPLLRDSALMDLGAIGTPLAIAPMLGIAGFGVYRAVSNVSAPVRLILDPLRPTLAGAPLTTHGSLRRVWATLVVSIGFGLAAYLGLMVVQLAHLELGSLTSVVAYAVPTALFVAASFLGHYYYVIARAHSYGHTLLIGRVAQTVSAISFPLVGAYCWGLEGAIWAYSVGTACSALTWFSLVIHSAIQQKTPPTRG